MHSVTYRCAQPAQQQGRRMPLFIFDIALVILIPLVSALAPEVTQQIHSLRASGVMSAHSARTLGFEVILLRKSAGRAWTVPPASF